MIRACGANELVGLRNKKRAVCLEQGEGGWLSGMGQNKEINFMIDLIEEWNSRL